MTINKKQLKTLLKKGLTGKEAAKLVIADSVEVDHNRKGFLSETELAAIKQGLKTDQEITVYNSWIKTYQIHGYTLKEAQIISLKCQNNIHFALRDFQFFITDNYLSHYLSDTPKLVTEKQYRDLKQQQVEMQFKQVVNLSELVNIVSESLVSPEQPQESGKSYREMIDNERLVPGLSEMIFKYYPVVFEQTLEQIIDPIAAGLLRPVILSQEVISKIEQLRIEYRAALDNEPKPKTIGDIVNSLAAKVHSQMNQIQEEGYSLLQQQTGEQREAILAELKEIKAGSLSEETEKDLWKYLLFSVQELYESIPACREWVDNFDDSIGGYAIIQKPKPEDLDENGYYKLDQWKTLARISGLERYQRLSAEKGGLETILKDTRKHIRDLMREYLAIKTVTDELSKIIEVNLGEDLDQWLQPLETLLDLYNASIEEASNHFAMPELPIIQIDRLKPDQGDIAYNRERVGLTLGDEWYREALETMAERLKSTEPEGDIYG